jgi:hypothetical protein
MLKKKFSKASIAVAVLATAMAVFLMIEFSAPDQSRNDDLSTDTASESGIALPAISRVRPVPEKDVRPALHSITDPAIPVGQRLAILEKSSRDLNADEFDYLYQLLRFRPESGDIESGWVMMNGIMSSLRTTDPEDGRFVRAMIGMIADPEEPEVPRDYAVQHLSVLLGTAEVELSGSLRSDALAALAGTLDDPGLARSSVPGTAISTLTSIAGKLNEEERSRLWARMDPFLENIIRGESESVLATRTSAIQSVATRKHPGSLPLIRELAASPDTEPSVRLSSVAALGLYGRQEDRELIERIRAGVPRLHFAATAALERLDNP